MAEDKELERLLWYVLGGSRGGGNRAKIIHELSVRPLNLNQMAERLGVDYRTVTHHVKVLKVNSLIFTDQEGYGAMYFLTPRLQAGLELFARVAAGLHLDFNARPSD